MATPQLILKLYEIMHKNNTIWNSTQLTLHKYFTQTYNYVYAQTICMHYNNIHF